MKCVVNDNSFFDRVLGTLFLPPIGFHGSDHAAIQLGWETSVRADEPASQRETAGNHDYPKEMCAYAEFGYADLREIPAKYPS